MKKLLIVLFVFVAVSAAQESATEEEPSIRTTVIWEPDTTRPTPPGPPPSEPPRPPTSETRPPRPPMPSEEPPASRPPRPPRPSTSRPPRPSEPPASRPTRPPRPPQPPRGPPCLVFGNILPFGVCRRRCERVDLPFARCPGRHLRCCLALPRQ